MHRGFIVFFFFCGSIHLSTQGFWQDQWRCFSDYEDIRAGSENLGIIKQAFDDAFQPTIHCSLVNNSNQRRMIVLDRGAATIEVNYDRVMTDPYYDFSKDFQFKCIRGHFVATYLPYFSYYKITPPYYEIDQYVTVTSIWCD